MLFMYKSWSWDFNFFSTPKKYEVEKKVGT
jgi:hypothetical protein